MNPSMFMKTWRATPPKESFPLGGLWFVLRHSAASFRALKNLNMPRIGRYILALVKDEKDLNEILPNLYAAFGKRYD